MKADEKLLATLGLCKKAGKLVVGFDAVAQAMQAGEAKLLALARDLSPKSAKEIIRIAEKYGIEHVRLGVAMEDIKRFVGKQAGILAITDQGLSRSVASKIDARQHEEEIV